MYFFQLWNFSSLDIDIILKTSIIKSQIDYVFSLRNKLHVQAIFTVTNNLGKFKRELRKMNQIIPVFLKKY